MHNQVYWLGTERVTFYARENREEIWVVKRNGSLLLVYERGLALKPQTPRDDKALKLRVA